MKRSGLIIVLVSGAVASQAVTFSNVIIQAPPLSSGSSFTTLGNSISLFAPNAIVGDGQVLRQGTLFMQYDATNIGPAMIANQVGINLAGVCLGSGTIYFTEMIIELDSAGNEVSGNIGSITHVFNSSSSAIWSDTINFSRPVLNFRAKKSFTLVAPDTNPGTAVNDLAAVATVNQNIQVVPEPATMTALGLGALALIRRRRAR